MAESYCPAQTVIAISAEDANLSRLKIELDVLDAAGAVRHWDQDGVVWQVCADAEFRCESWAISATENEFIIRPHEMT